MSELSKTQKFSNYWKFVRNIVVNRKEIVEPKIEEVIKNIPLRNTILEVSGGKSEERIDTINMSEKIDLDKDTTDFRTVELSFGFNFDGKIFYRIIFNERIKKF